MQSNYKDKVIHFTGGLNDYVGELDQRPHKNGKNWYRILNPCVVQYVNAPGEAHQMRLVAIQGNGDFVKKWVDIRIPAESIIEIRTVDKQGDLYKAYKKESARKKSNIIQAPDSRILH